ncbi:MAG: ABC transporter substrate-binding protein [Planctomycetota bacterium]
MVPLLALGAAGCDNNPYPPEGDKVVLHGGLHEDPKSLDPVTASDVTSNAIICQIYDSLYQYHYLKRPYEVEPSLAAAMPTYSDDGLTVTIPVKKGVRFQDDPCFPGGKGREVVASDFVYSVKRLADVANKTTGWWTLKGKVSGLDAFHEASVEAVRAKEPLDYDAYEIEGLRAPDDYTIRLKLTQKYPQLKYILGMSFTAIVPREAVKYHGKDFANHPVGTGAFRLKQWKKQHYMILERNPTHRDEFYPGEGEPGDREAGLLDDAGEKLPLCDEVRYTIFKQSQPSWILFTQGYLDASGIPKDNFDKAVPDGQQLSEELRAKGITLVKRVSPDVFYWGFNMRDKVVGYHPDPEQNDRNKKLRQALSCAYDRERTIKVFHNGRGIPAKSMLPPPCYGYDPDLENPYAELNLPLARKLLAEAGYPNGKDADGDQLVLEFDTTADSPAGMQRIKAFQRDMEKVGVKIEIVVNTWAQLQEKTREGRVQFYSMGWVWDFPDPQNFLQLLYGPNKSPGPNNSHYNNPEYNRLFEKMEPMENGPERLKIIRRMIEIANEDCPWILDLHRIGYGLRHQWVRNRKPTDMSGNFLKYRTVDVDLRERCLAKWNRPSPVPLLILAGVLGLVLVAAVIVGRHLPPRLATRKEPETQ